MAVLCAVFAVAGCGLRYLRPPGVGPLRYRDPVFNAVSRTTDVTYGSAVNEQGQPISLTLDVYTPAGDSNTSRPAIVWLHGGSFVGGDKTSFEIVDEANTFATKGYVNVSINYRLSSAVCPQWTPTSVCDVAAVNAMHDAQAAVRFLRAHADTYGVDPSRIAIGGTSAGAIRALDVGYNPGNPGTSGNPGFPSDVRAAVSLSGARLVGAASPGESAALLFHGTADFVVPYAWAADTVASAQAAGLVAELTTWQDGGHVPYVENRGEILDQTTNFLYWTLDLSNP